MFSFFKSNRNKFSNYFPITTDIHSHILPGIDDGSPNLETSIMLIKGLKKLGINRSIATPHIISDLFRNNPNSIHGALSLLRAELQRQSIDFELDAAAEYMLDPYFFELLQNRQPLLTVYDNFILTEFSYVSPPDELSKMSFEIISAGYIPILAHPERYSFFNRNFRMYNHLVDLGFLLQVNLLSLTGYYGKDCMKSAQYILENNLASFVATDLHHEKHLEMLTDKKNRILFHEMLSHRKWNELSIGTSRSAFK